MALLALKISSRKISSASGSMPVVTVATTPSRRRAMSMGPNSSFGSEKRVSMYSTSGPRTARGHSPSLFVSGHGQRRQVAQPSFCKDHLHDLERRSRWRPARPGVLGQALGIEQTQTKVIELAGRFRPLDEASEHAGQRPAAQD